MKIEKYLPRILVSAGFIGLISAFTLGVEKINLLKDPEKQLGCDLNPIIACGSVINTDQASALGFPNPFLGLAGFGALLTVGVVLFSGAKLSKRFWQFVLVGLGLATVFAHWLIFQTIYRIEALCPFCMVIWVVTIVSFWYVLVYNLNQRNINLPPNLRGAASFVQKHHFDILAVWFLALIALILNHFWYYWKTLL
jgi:uncharacterized membrane protein